MKITAHITDQEFAKIEPWIDSEFLNPEEELFIFTDASEQFRMILTLFNITYYR